MNPVAKWGATLRSKLAETRKASRNVPRAFGLFWGADPATATGLGTLAILAALLPAAQAWIAKVIIDQVVGHVPFERVWPYLGIEFALLFLSSGLAQLRRLAEELMDHRLGHRVHTLIIERSLGLELEHFENAEFYDKLSNARRQAEYRAVAVVTSGFGILQSTVTLVSFFAVLVMLSPWIALALVGAAVPAFIVQSRYGKLNFRLQSWRAPETRRMIYLEQLLTTDTTIKEVKLFGLGPKLLAAYDAIFRKTFDEDRKLAWKRSGQSLIWGAASLIAYSGCYAYIVRLALGGAITLGQMTLYVALFRQSQSQVQAVFDHLARLFESGLFLDNLFEFIEFQPPATGGRTLVRAEASSITPGIVLDRVSFRYPHAAHATLQELSLHIRPGEKLAVVGENGAGKTTLVKLLTRLYEPTEGRILWDGVDLRDIPRDVLHQRVGAIFQDFVRYQLTARENVGFGAIDRMDAPDGEGNARLLEAARLGGADDVVRELEHGWDTTLGNWFKEGRELSGGQWQKMALSRAFMRESELIILDEPTSALDAEREHEVFQKFQALTRGKMSLLISHRFSTVRMADRILVLGGGKLLELGSHAELLARDGTYARLFRLQAQGYAS